MQYYFVWTAIFVTLCVIEANTSNLVTIWFALGALITLVCTALGVAVPWQFGIFIVSSVILLALTRPLVKKKFNSSPEKTNAQSVIGKTAIVIDSITPDKFSGVVKVGGQEWSAVTKDGVTIETGAEVTVESIDGVKLVVVNKIKTEV